VQANGTQLEQIFFCRGGAVLGFEFRALSFARQAFYHLNHTSSSYFFLNVRKVSDYQVVDTTKSEYT
jgi:hypothetical protein